jgi:hypothetical protein
VTVGALLSGARSAPFVDGSIVYASARRLMDGTVYGMG